LGYADYVHRRAWIVFAALQLPGLLIERLFWNTGASLQSLSLVRVPVSLLINAIVWLFLAYVFTAAQKVRRESAAMSGKRL
jgi:hypothetical protein